MTRLYFACLLAFSAWGAGAAYGMRTGEKLAALESLCDFLQSLEESVFAVRKPLSKLFKACGDEYLSGRGFITALCAGGSAGENWRAALETIPLSPRARQAAGALGADLGRLTLERQLKRIAETKNALCALRAEERELAKKKRETSRAIGLLIGVTAAIILL